MTIGTDGLFHLRGGFYYGREGDQVVIAFKQETGIAGVDALVIDRIPLNEWASAVAVTTAEGETAETYRAALDLIGGLDWTAPMSDAGMSPGGFREV